MTVPVLLQDQIYIAHDRYVCGTVACAGMTALYTGVTIGGAVLSPVTDEEAAEWATYDLGPLTCECGRLVYEGTWSRP
jgi:hypothetical protein